MSRTNHEWDLLFGEIIEKVRTVSSDRPDTSKLEADPAQIAGYIDHTLLKLDASQQQIDKLCDEAAENNFAAICLRETFVLRAKENSATINIPIACVVGFHEGTQSELVKIDEAKRAIANGALELDMVLNRDMIHDKKYEEVFSELQKVRGIASDLVQLKLILETSMLNTRDIIVACTLAAYARWDYIKTSTGFNGRGASIDDIKLMYKLTLILSQQVGDQNSLAKRMKVKASGGIRSFSDAKVMIRAGASRIGTSAGITIMKEARARVTMKETSVRSGTMQKSNCMSR